MTKELTQTELKEIRERCEAATPGPWHASLCEWECDCYGEKLNNCGKEPDTCGEGRVLTGAFVTETKTTDWGDYCDMNDADAEFCAHARQDIPALLSRIDHLQTALDAANKRAEAAVADINLLDARGWLCKYRDGGACIKDGARQICTYGTCSANACKEKIWRGQEGE